MIDLKKWREARNLSQSQLAAHLPVSVRTLQGWELDPPKGKPPEYLVRALSDLDRELKRANKTRLA